MAEVIFQEKIIEAKRRRKESKKMEKMKFKNEVEIVRRNIEKRDEIWKQQQLADIWRYNMHQQNYYKLEKLKEIGDKKETQIKNIKKKEKQIKKLMNIEN